MVASLLIITISDIHYFTKLFSHENIIVVCLTGSYLLIETLFIKKSNPPVYAMVYVVFLGFALFSRKQMDSYYFELDFKYFIQYLSSGISDLESIANLLGNTLLFVPLGCVIYLSGTTKTSRWFCLAISMIVIIPCIEFLQPLLQVGMGDLADIFLNWTSLFIGYAYCSFASNFQWKNHLLNSSVKHTLD